MKTDFLVFEKAKEASAPEGSYSSWNFAYILDDYNSIVWHMVYDGIGTCSIEAPLTSANVAALVTGNIIANPNKARLSVYRAQGTEAWPYQEYLEACVITEVQLDYENQVMTVNGESLETLLENRVLSRYGTLSGQHEIQATVYDWITVMNHGTDRAFNIDPSLLNLGQGGTWAYSGYISDYAYSYKTMWASGSEMCATFTENQNTENPNNHLSFMLRVLMRETTSAQYPVQVVAGCFWGIDRTVFWPAASQLEKVTLRDDVEDVSNLSLTRSITGTSTAVFVAGEGEGDARTVTWYIAPGAVTGAARREIFVDARDLRREDYASDDAYLTALQNRGREKITLEAESLEFTISQSVNFEYRKDYYVGDTVEVVMTALGASYDMRVSGAIENYTGDGYTLELEMGQPLETFAKKMNKKLR